MRKDYREEIFKSPKTVFRLKDIGILLGEKDTDNLKAKANYYASNNVMRNIRRGIYVKDKYLPAELACNIYSPSYISLETILVKAGVMFQYTAVITAVSYLSRTITVDGNVISYRKIRDSVLVNDAGIEQKQNVNIATPERALLDMMYLNKNCFFDNLNGIDRTRTETILNIYNSQALRQRVMRLFRNDRS